MKRSCNFSIVTKAYNVAYSPSFLIKLTRGELANVVLDYQYKIDNCLESISAELLELKTKFTKMEVDLSISRNVSVKLVERLVVTGLKCCANEQYSCKECLEMSGIPESVSDNTLEDKIQEVLHGIDVEVDTENIESCHRLKGKGNKGKVILKLSKRKEADKIKSTK